MLLMRIDLFIFLPLLSKFWELLFGLYCPITSCAQSLYQKLKLSINFSLLILLGKGVFLQNCNFTLCI